MIIIYCTDIAIVIICSMWNNDEYVCNYITVSHHHLYKLFVSIMMCISLSYH